MRMTEYIGTERNAMTNINKNRRFQAPVRADAAAFFDRRALSIYTRARICK